MYRKEVTIVNESGLHARPASVFVSQAKKFQSRIWARNISSGSEAFNAKSIVLLLAQGMGRGTQIEISAEGPDEQLAVDTLADFISSGCGE